MVLTVIALLVVAALIGTIVSMAGGPCPLSVPVLLLAIAAALQVLPLGR